MTDKEPHMASKAKGYVDELLVGAAAVDLPAERRNDPDNPAYVKALVFQQGEVQAVLVICDLISVAAPFHWPGKELAAEESGIALDNICLAATHTHSNPKRPDDEDLAQRIAQAVTEAQAAARPVKVLSGTGYRNDISFNRRYLMCDGTVMMNPGVLNPDIVRPVGPIDPEVNFLLFRNAGDGEPYASLTSFAVHLCCQARGYEQYTRRADWACWLERSLREEFGSGFISVVAEACCEDIGHIDTNRPSAGDKPVTRGQFMLHDYVPRKTDLPPSPLNPKYVGDAIAEAIRNILPALREERPVLESRRDVIQVPLGAYSETDLAWAKSADYPNVSWLMQFYINRILSVARLRARYGETMPVAVRALRIGVDTAIATLPGQIFVELGLELKHRSPFANTFAIELADEWEGIAIVPTRKAYIEGHFEVIDSCLESGAGEMMVDAAVRLLETLDARART